MDEMAKTLARRRAIAEKKDTPNNDDRAGSDSERKNSGSGKLNGSTSSGLLVPNSGDSPLGTRKRSGSSGEESTLRGVNTNGNAESSADLDLLKQELLHEIRKEMNKMKQEIIEVIRQELSRR